MENLPAMWRRMMVVFVLTSMATVISAGHLREPERALSETVIAFNAAIVKKDRRQLHEFISQDFYWITGSGLRGDRASFIDALTKAGLEIAPYTPAESEWVVGDGMALYVAYNKLTGTSDGAPFVDPHRFSNLWRLRDGRWQVVFIQITPTLETAAIGANSKVYV